MEIFGRGVFFAYSTSPTGYVRLAGNISVVILGILGGFYCSLTHREEVEDIGF